MNGSQWIHMTSKNVSVDPTDTFLQVICITMTIRELSSVVELSNCHCD